MKRIIETDAAPTAVGAYSQGATDGSLVFTAGQIPLMPSGDLVDGSVGTQTRQTLENVAAVLEAEGASLEDALKITVYLADIEEYDAMNGVYQDFFESDPPARSAFAVDALPMGAGVEIEAIATLPDHGSTTD
jgi:2-iminobutanoate/2-iminopropanoate deaminase